MATATALVALLGSGLAGIATASTQSELDSARANARGLAGQVNAQQANVQAAARAAASADAARGKLETLLANGRRQAARLARRARADQRRLHAAQARLGRARQALARRLVAIYKGEVPDAANLLLQADGFDDLVYESVYMDRIRNGDSQLAARVRGVRNEVRSAYQAVRAAEAAVAAHNTAVAQARDQQAAVAADARARMAAFQAARARQQANLSRLQGQIDSLTRQVAIQNRVSQATARSQVLAGFSGDWSIPSYIVRCESGGNYRARNPSGAGGAYQIMPETWRHYGGSGSPESASPHDQDRIAAQIWADSGPAAWSCAR